MSAEAKIRDAIAAGRAAQRDRKPRTACPHGGDTPEARVLRDMWRRGWDQQNPMPIVDDADADQP